MWSGRNLLHSSLIMAGCIKGELLELNSEFKIMAHSVSSLEIPVHSRVAPDEG